MMRLLSLLHGLTLCLLLVLTGQALAIARGAPLPVGQVELCTGSGPVMVSIGADGAPVTPPHYCPEGVLSLLQAVAALEWAAPVRTLTRVVAEPVAPWRAPSLRRAVARSRGPPLGTASAV